MSKLTKEDYWKSLVRRDKAASDIIKEIQCCERSLIWASDKTQGQAWIECQIVDWIIYIAFKLGPFTKSEYIDYAEWCIDYAEQSYKFKEYKYPKSIDYLRTSNEFMDRLKQDIYAGDVASDCAWIARLCIAALTVENIEQEQVIAKIFCDEFRRRYDPFKQL